jgi:hypothetical protein
MSILWKELWLSMRKATGIPPFLLEPNFNLLSIQPFPSIWPPFILDSQRAANSYKFRYSVINEVPGACICLI